MKTTKDRLQYYIFFIPLFVFIVIQFFYFDFIPIWDGRWYLDFLFNAIEKPFFLLNYNLAGHPSFAYALLLERGGFLLCTLLFLATIFSYVGKQRWYWIYIGSPAITFLFYAVFKIWLKIQLPVGFMGI